MAFISSFWQKTTTLIVDNELLNDHGVHLMGVGIHLIAAKKRM